MVFTRNRQRLMDHDVDRALFDEVVWAADGEGLLSDEHFSVDGTLIEAAASLKSFRPKEGAPPLTDDDPGNPSVDFRGNAGATRPTPAPRTPRRVCCVRARARKQSWRFWAMP